MGFAIVVAYKDTTNKSNKIPIPAKVMNEIPGERIAFNRLATACCDRSRFDDARCALFDPDGESLSVAKTPVNLRRKPVGVDCLGAVGDAERKN